MQEYYDRIIEAITDGETDEIVDIAKEAIEAGAKPEDLINKGGVVALEALGKAFDDMEAFLPDLMLGGEAMHAMLEYLNPMLKNEGGSVGSTVVLGCAQGDLHDIGLNLVATQLSVAGFNVINLGTDVKNSELIATAKQHNAKIIGVSTLLTTSAYYQEELVKQLNKEGITDIMVIVGGGPITPDWTKKIGADGYSRTANQAAELCRRLVAGESERPIIIE